MAPNVACIGARTSGAFGLKSAVSTALGLLGGENIMGHLLIIGGSDAGVSAAGYLLPMIQWLLFHQERLIFSIWARPRNSSRN